MLKRIIPASILIILLSFNLAMAGSFGMYLGQANYKKVMELIKTYKIKAVDEYLEEDGAKEPYRASYYELDGSGNVTKSIAYHPDGSIYCCYKNKFKYGLNNNKIEEINYTTAGNINSRDTYKYDINGNLMEHVNYIGDGILPVSKNIYLNRNGIVVNTGWHIGGAYRFSVDKSVGGKLVRRNWFDENGGLCENTFMYDERGKLVENFINVPENERFISNKFQYDANGNLIYTESIVPVPIFNEGKKMTVTKGNAIMKYSYDERNNLIEETSYLNGAVKDYTKYSYDDRGFVTKVTQFDRSDNTASTRTYSYRDRRDPRASAKFKKNDIGVKVSACQDNTCILSIAAGAYKHYFGKIPENIREIAESGVLSTELKCSAGGKYKITDAKKLENVRVKCQQHGDLMPPVFGE